MAKKPVLLCIMDGFGWVPNETFGNAVVAAKTPHLDALMEKYPMTTIDASGMAVGLPDGQMGNSEVGHTNMGAGRIVYQQLTLITKSIRDGEMLKNPVLVEGRHRGRQGAIHLMGLWALAACTAMPTTGLACQDAPQYAPGSWRQVSTLTASPFI